MKKNKNAIPDIVIERLPRYFRYLRSQLGKQEKVSSRQLADHLSTSASQVRHDLSYFGGFGLQGYGYRVEDLYQKIGEILGVTSERYYAIAGAGGLGQALARYPVFEEVGFRLAAVFDNDLQKIGREVAGRTILDVTGLGDYVCKNNIDIVVITTPASAAQEIVDIVAEAGCGGILNFAPVDLQIPEGMQMKNIYLTDKLLALSYRLQHGCCGQGAD